VTVIRHGLSIGIERVGSEFFLTLKAVGKLEHADYETIVPMLESALQGVKDPDIKVFFDGTEMEGWEIRAAWDDFKLGLKHGGKFSKLAIVGNKRWQELSAKIGSWFIAGEAKYFENAEDAFKWLGE